MRSGPVYHFSTNLFLAHHAWDETHSRRPLAMQHNHKEHLETFCPILVWRYGSYLPSHNSANRNHLQTQKVVNE